MERKKEQRRALVTGGTGAIGEAIARGLALAGLQVVITARNEAKAKACIQRICGDTGNSEIRHEMVDLSQWASIASLAARWEGPLHLVVNNAAQTPRRREETPEGIELQWATNVLGYVWTMLAFEEQLAAWAPARVVNVASYWAGDLDLRDPEFKRRRYDNNLAYRQSKQANRMLSAAFARRWAGRGISVNSCHPGDVNSRLSNNLGFGGHESPDQGARTPIWLALEAASDTTGGYFSGCSLRHCPFASDDVGVEKLYQMCLEYPRV